MLTQNRQRPSVRSKELISAVLSVMTGKSSPNWLPRKKPLGCVHRLLNLVSGYHTPGDNRWIAGTVTLIGLEIPARVR